MQHRHQLSRVAERSTWRTATVLTSPTGRQHVYSGELIPGREVYLRAVEESDLPVLKFLLNDAMTALFAGSSSLPTSERNHAEFHSSTQRADTHLAIVLRDSDETVGVTQISALDWRVQSADSGIKILESHRGRGIALDACRARDAFLFFRLGLRRLEWRVLDFNKPSQRLAERLGYRHEGTLREVASIDGRWRNLEIFSLLRDEASQIRELEWYRSAVCPGLEPRA